VVHCARSAADAIRPKKTSNIIFENKNKKETLNTEAEVTRLKTQNNENGKYEEIIQKSNY